MPRKPAAWVVVRAAMIAGVSTGSCVEEIPLISVELNPSNCDSVRAAMLVFEIARTTVVVIPANCADVSAPNFPVLICPICTRPSSCAAVREAMLPAERASS